MNPLREQIAQALIDADARGAGVPTVELLCIYPAERQRWLDGADAVIAVLAQEGIIRWSY